MTRNWISGMLAIGLAAAAPPLAAQSLDTAALEQIQQTATVICGDYARAGFAKSAAVEGAAKAELKGLFSRLADLGIEGAGSVQSGQYDNVLQEELPGELKDVRRCRENIFNRIWDDLKRSAAAPQPAAPQADPQSNLVPVQPLQPPLQPFQPQVPDRQQPAGDVAGYWTFIALCPGVFGETAKLSGEIESRPVGGNRFEGVISNDLGMTGRIVSTVSGSTVSSVMTWPDYSTTHSWGVLSPDGSTWSGRDSQGCSAKATRG